MDDKLKDQYINLDYSDEGWEVDQVLTTYEYDDENEFNFDKKIIEIELENTKTNTWHHLELKIRSSEFAWFVSSLIEDDDELAQKVREHLEKREKELPRELIAEIKAEEKNNN